MQNDPRERAHTEAGPLWYTVHIEHRPNCRRDRVVSFYLQVQQPVSDNKLRMVLQRRHGLKYGVHQTSPRRGLLLGDHRVAGSYTILDPPRSTRV